MTTTPGPRTEAGKRLLVELGENPLPGAVYALGVVEMRLPKVEAETRADVDGLVARVAELENGLRLLYDATIRGNGLVHIAGIRALLAGDKAAGWTTEQAIDLGQTLAKRGREMSAGDKAEAPR